MEKIRSTGIIVCSIVFILLFFMSLMVAFIAGISGPSKEEAIKGPSPLRLLFILFPIGILISTFGLWYKKGWGRICSLFVSTIVSIAMAYLFYGSLFLVNREMVLQNRTFAAIVVIIGVVFIGIIFYLTRPKVIEQFK